MRGLVVVAAIGLVIGLLSLAGGDRFSGDLSGDDLMHLAYLGALASFVGWGFFTGGWRNVREDIRNLAFWFGALIILTGVYAYRFEFKVMGQRVLGGLVPGMAVDGAGEVSVSRSRGGMFLVDGAVNGTNVRFIFDTGASGVSLTAEDAKRAGLTPGPNDYTLQTRTANGIALVAPVMIDRLSIGGITLSRVQATVSKEGALSRSLLGHSYLERLKSYEVRGDRLILRGN